MIGIINKHWPFIITVSILWIIVAILLTLSLRQTQGHLVYVLDDPYVHMAVAKNLAHYGVWGVTKYGFSSSTSSILWPLLLYFVYSSLGVNDITPFILNVVLATIMVWLIYAILKRYNVTPTFIITILLILVLATPIPLLIFSGHEHILHAIVNISLIYLSAKLLSNEDTQNKKNFYFYKITLLLLSLIVTMSRYEGLFSIIVICIVFLVYKKYFFSFCLGFIGIIPIIIYGIISISNGWYFLPNSVYLKGSMPDGFTIWNLINFFYTGFQYLQLMPSLFHLILISLIIFIFQYNKKNGKLSESEIMIIIFILTTIIHIEFIRNIWFYRREAYLVASGIFVIAAALPLQFANLTSSLLNKSLLKNIAITILAFILILPFLERGVSSLFNIFKASKNIYEQQYQMGLFFKQYYQGEIVAANDIGAINYLSEIKNFDLWGLGSMEVARAKINNDYNTDKIYELGKSKNVKIAIVYDHWLMYYGGIPSKWKNVGTWSITNNVVCGGNTVSFYAVDSLEVPNLTANLKEFSTQLPKDVIQRGEYIK